MEKMVKTALCVVAAVLATGCSGGGTPATSETPRAVSVPEPTAQNELPFGNVENPPANAVVPPTFAVSGWALDDRSIEVVRVFVDNRFRLSARLTTDRSDVSKAFPAYSRQSDRHGFEAALLVEQPGLHTVLVQAIDRDGATKDIGVVTITVKP
jgi:hypothetical protein